MILFVPTCLIARLKLSPLVWLIVISLLDPSCKISIIKSSPVWLIVISLSANAGMDIIVKNIKNNLFILCYAYVYTVTTV